VVGIRRLLGYCGPCSFTEWKHWRVFFFFFFFSFSFLCVVGQRMIGSGLASVVSYSRLCRGSVCRCNFCFWEFLCRLLSFLFFPLFLVFLVGLVSFFHIRFGLLGLACGLFFFFFLCVRSGTSLYWVSRLVQTLFLSFLVCLAA